MFANESRERSLEQINVFGRRIEEARRVRRRAIETVRARGAPPPTS
jgi:hypothetical protein